MLNTRTYLHFLLESLALLISGTYGLPFAYHMFVLYYIHSIYTYSHAAYHAMSSAGPRRSMFRAIVWLVPFAKLMHHIEVVYILIYNVYNTALNIIWAHMIQNRCHTLCNKATSCIAFIYICMCTYLLICALYTCRPDLGRMTGCRLWNASWQTVGRPGGRAGGRAVGPLPIGYCLCHVAYWLPLLLACYLLPMPRPCHNLCNWHVIVWEFVVFGISFLCYLFWKLMCIYSMM